MSAGPWVLLWSRQQNTLHVETLAQHTSLNRQAYADNLPGDYRLLLVGTKAEVDATATSIRPTMAARASFSDPNHAEAA